MSPNILSPEYEKVPVGDDSINPYALPQSTRSAHANQQSGTSDIGYGDPKGSESDDLQQPTGQGQRTTPTKTKRIGSVISLIKLAILPIVTVAYLGFCYTVQKHVIVVDGNGIVDTSPERLSSIKSAVTSISILIISLGLWPLKGLLDDLKHEEFFRVLHQRPEGVPLSVINDITFASHLRSAIAVIKRKVSPHFVAGFFAGLVCVVASTLAPAALSVESVIFDDDLIAFEVGAIPTGSVINTTNPLLDVKSLTRTSDTLKNITDRVNEVAYLSWAEIGLGLHYEFTANDQDNETYLVPYPPKLLTTIRARWLTDVIVINPDCQWLQTNATSLSQPLNLSEFDLLHPLTLNLPGWGVNFDYPIATFSADPASLTLVDPLQVKNASTNDLDDRGRMVWIIGQALNHSANGGIERISFDLGSIPTFVVSGVDSEYQVGVLGCTPNLAVETREVRSVGGGNIVAFPGKYQPQRNIHPLQAAFLLSNAVIGLPQTSGPALDTDSAGIGTRMAATFVFGDQVSAYNDTNQDRYLWTPAPLANITQFYRQVLQSTTKPFLSGVLGTAYVPGRTSQEVIIFTSSATYIAVSAAFLALLSGMVVFSHFRKGKGDTFTLFSVAAALNNSEVVAQFVQFRQEHNGVSGRRLQSTVEKTWGGRPIVLRKQMDRKARLGFGLEKLD